MVMWAVQSSANSSKLKRGSLGTERSAESPACLGEKERKRERESERERGREMERLRRRPPCSFQGRFQGLGLEPVLREQTRTSNSEVAHRLRR